MNKKLAERLMGKCINTALSEYKEGQYPLGAMVVDENGEVITKLCSNLNAGYDVSAHPEMVAIRQACNIRKARYLKDCYLVTTLEPCPMCTSVAIWAKMKGIIYGASQSDAIDYSKNHPNSKLSWRQIKVPSSYIISYGEPKLELYENILEEECKKLLDEDYVKNINKNIKGVSK
ncbi:MAG: nucleoside deaminase [Bacilli bacterium]|nr:nucleoside deaminase [Bacilli bacterium]